ncbi:4-hydroxy-tetrahydrodipicolinate reductase 2, chloroplastic-like [Senna tora]|uniref:4-hydroxy-tetrahydrodipicolinate reductase 2, chloroplastic-like n=1 Tax=Senna tora TaxID=362788 RepID=A0A834TRL8_9FABA|nr:4-hydroxy-tetrahydrodipicolinate reductase 2, chloroplastic-like [Senna tora]
MASSDEPILDASASPEDYPSSPSSASSFDSLFQDYLDNFPLPSPDEGAIPIMVNSCTGKMGRAVITEALLREMFVIPVSFGSEATSGQTYDICGKKIYKQGFYHREIVLEILLDKYPNMIVVDFTESSAVNDNVELYCYFGVPFVLGTHGGDRSLMHQKVKDSKGYALISSHIGKQGIAFLGILEHMANRFPGIFAGYSLRVSDGPQYSRNFKNAGRGKDRGRKNGRGREKVWNEVGRVASLWKASSKDAVLAATRVIGSLDESKDQSYTIAKAAIACFKKMGVASNTNQVELYRDPKLQQELVGIHKEHLSCHEYQLFGLTSPDKTDLFQFQLKVGGRSMYARGTIDAVKFLAKKIKEQDGKKLYNIIDVLQAGYIE